MIALFLAKFAIGDTLKAFFTFLASPLAKYIALALLCLGLYAWGYHAGTSRANARCESEKAQSVEAAHKLDEDAAAKAAALRKRELEDEAAREKGYQEQIDAYAKSHSSCSLGDAGAGFLDSLRGGSVQGAKPLPPARGRRGT